MCGVENEEDASYCARCGEPLKEGAPRIVYHSEWGEKDEKGEKQEKHEKDEYDEKGDTASRNWVAIFGILIVIAGVISLLDTWSRVWWASWDRLWPLLIIVFGLFIVWNVLKARERSPRPY